MLQVDTGFDFPEMLAIWDKWIERLGVRLVATSVDDAIKNGVVVDDGKTSRNRLQVSTLLNAIETEGFTAAFGGGQLYEEKARAKERVYAHRDEFGQWDPKLQRPDLRRPNRFTTPAADPGEYPLRGQPSEYPPNTVGTKGPTGTRGIRIGYDRAVVDLFVTDLTSRHSVPEA